MKRLLSISWIGAAAAALLLSATLAYAGPYDLTRCEMLYNLKGWSFAIKLQQGQGTIVCDNGQRTDVDLSASAVGFTIGKSEIIGGKAGFTPVRDIDELLGQYVAAEAHAGFGRSGEARALTKGEVSLTLAGSGNGVDVGAAIGGFTITRR